MQSNSKYYLLIATFAVAVPNLFATVYDGNGNITLVDNTSLYSYSDGGEFRAAADQDLSSAVNWSAYSTETMGTLSDATDGGSWGYGSGLAQNGTRYFQTFCTELSEEFSPGGTYNVSSIGNNALYAGTGHPVPITLGVAYLYSQFAAGTLNGYDYTYGARRSDTAGDLQSAIWFLLGEGGSLTTGGWVYDDLTNGVSMTSSKWFTTANGAYGVADMTLGAPGQAQDQLVMAVPEASTVFAATLLLLPFGMSAVRIARRTRGV